MDTFIETLDRKFPFVLNMNIKIERKKLQLLDFA